MKIGLKVTLLTVIMSFISASVIAAEPKILMQYQDVIITDTDFNNLIDMVVPKEKQSYFLGDEKRILIMLQDMFLSRLLAKKAIDAKLDADAALQFKIKSQTEKLLMQAMLTTMTEAVETPDFDNQAKEYFLANPEEFQIPVKVHASHILISPKDGRTEAEGLKLAQQVMSKALVSDADFASLAKEFSDDKSAATNNGDLGFFEVTKMVKPFADAAFAMSTPGEISKPIKTRFGFHIIKYHDRTMAEPLVFAKIKDQLITKLKKQFKVTAKQKIVSDLKAMSGVVVNSEAIHLLITND